MVSTARFSTLIAAAALVSACGGHTTSAPMNAMPAAPQVVQLPALESDLAMTAILPARTIGEELPSEGLGSIRSPAWKAVVGGFTQKRYSQTLAFPPGTKITIRNLSKSLPHTLDVVEQVSGPPANFPKSPTLSIAARGNGKLQRGYASGEIKPGKAVTVTLVKAGYFLIGCAFHYGEGMRDVIIVKNGAKPGAQATPPPAASGPTPTPYPTPGGGGWQAP
jgi:plastocyanin